MNNHLTASQRSTLRAELEQRQQALQRQIDDHLRGRTRAERAHDDAQQETDDAQRAPEREIATVLTERERNELGAIDNALKRIEGGAYGVCIDCAAGIPFDRLKAEPWALRCVVCAAKREKGVTARG